HRDYPVVVGVLPVHEPDELIVSLAESLITVTRTVEDNLWKQGVLPQHLRGLFYAGLHSPAHPLPETGREPVVEASLERSRLSELLAVDPAMRVVTPLVHEPLGEAKGNNDQPHTGNSKQE